jgi:hypothetical protein
MPIFIVKIRILTVRRSMATSIAKKAVEFAIETSEEQASNWID